MIASYFPTYRSRQRLVLCAAAIVAIPSLHASAADTILESVAVKTTTADGKAWDPFGGAPDLKVIITRAGLRDISTVKKNVFAATFNRTSLRVKEGDEIEIVVWDNDPGKDDFIGSTKIVITASFLRKGSAEFTFNRVTSLRLKFMP